MSSYFEIPETIQIDDDDESLANCEILTKYVNEFLIDQIKDGDVLGPLKVQQYRNAGCYFWDGKEQKVILFGSDLDEDGCLPPSFDIVRFGIHHFDNVMEHNSYVRVSKDCIDQIIRTAEYGVSPILNKKAVWAYFFVNDQKYYVIGVSTDASYKESEIIGARSYGWIVANANLSQYDLESSEYAANFMRLFISNVHNGQIDSVAHEEGYDVKNNVLYVHC